MATLQKNFKPELCVEQEIDDYVCVSVCVSGRVCVLLFVKFVLHEYLLKECV